MRPSQQRNLLQTAEAQQLQANEHHFIGAVLLGSEAVVAAAGDAALQIVRDQKLVTVNYTPTTTTGEPINESTLHDILASNPHAPEKVVSERVLAVSSVTAELSERRRHKGDTAKVMLALPNDIGSHIRTMRRIAYNAVNRRGLPINRKLVNQQNGGCTITRSIPTEQAQAIVETINALPHGRLILSKAKPIKGREEHTT